MGGFGCPGDSPGFGGGLCDEWGQFAVDLSFFVLGSVAWELFDELVAQLQISFPFIGRVTSPFCCKLARQHIFFSFLFVGIDDVGRGLDWQEVIVVVVFLADDGLDPLSDEFFERRLLVERGGVGAEGHVSVDLDLPVEVVGGLHGPCLIILCQNISRMAIPYADHSSRLHLLLELLSRFLVQLVLLVRFLPVVLVVLLQLLPVFDQLGVGPADLLDRLVFVALQETGDKGMSTLGPGAHTHCVLQARLPAV